MIELHMNTLWMDMDSIFLEVANFFEGIVIKNIDLVLCIDKDPLQ